MSRNSGFEYRDRIGADDGGTSLLAYLAGRYRHSPASTWSARIEAGLVLLDDEPAAPETALRAGQVVVWRRPSWEEPHAPTDFGVVFEDDDLIAVSKPSGLPTLPGGGFLETTLLHHVRRIAPGASPLHRLGRFTSGIVLFARTRGARAQLSSQWMAREVRKRYRTIASGAPRHDAFDVDVPIGPVPHAILGTVHGASLAGKPAHSRVAVLERRGDRFLCDVWITTGRPHQIRIHLAAARHPLVGDPLYGAGGIPAPGSRAVPGDGGYFLHAAELRFRHPREPREVTVLCEAPAPPAARA